MLRNTAIVRQMAEGLKIKASYKQEDKNDEIERVYFAKLSDFDQLSSAPIPKNTNSGNIACSKTSGPSVL